MKRRLELTLLATVLWTLPVFAAEPTCDFSTEDLLSIRQSKLFKVGPKVRTPLPLELFQAHVDEIGEFDAEKCADAVVVSNVEYEPSGRIYDVYSTDQDDCDGGNSFGLAVDRAGETVVAVINDQSFTCIAE